MANINVKKVKAADVELKHKVVSINRVAKVTKGGRTFSFSAIVVVGDNNGIVGHGLGKAREVTAKVIIRPASEGTGVIAGGAMRAVLEYSGVTDVIAKSLGSSNPHNVVKATVNALASLRSSVTVAKQRGIELEKVFNG